MICFFFMSLKSQSTDQNYNNMYLQATPRLSEDKVKQCVDPKLNNDYPPKAIAKVWILTFISCYYLCLLSMPTLGGKN